MLSFATHPLKNLSPSLMARAMARSIPLSLRPTFSKPHFISNLPTQLRTNISLKLSSISGLWVGNKSYKDGVFLGNEMRVFCGNGGFGGGERGYRRLRRKIKKKAKDLELSVQILIEEGLPNDPEILSIAEMLRLNAPMAMKLAIDGLKNPEYKTRDTSINDVAGFDTIELSLLLCNDDFIRKLNKEWRDEDHATDVLSMSQHIPELQLPILMLGDIVISVETAARQAEERGHALLDEIRILLVHGLLHLLGFDHELSEEAEEEMEKEEELLLKNLGWKGKGLIKSACDTENNGSLHVRDSDGKKKAVFDSIDQNSNISSATWMVRVRIDSTLLNSKSQISPANANAVREALSRGVQVVVATGKARPGAMDVLRAVDLVGRNGILSESSPGVFLQGLLVYGIQGREIFRKNLDLDFCRQAFSYSLEQQIPLVAFCGDRCLTLFDHPRVDSLHSVYHEPKAEIMPSVGQLLATAEVQKLIFLDTAERIATTIRPYWSEASGDHASVVQAISDMLEIVPHGTSKGNGVKLLLDHLGVSSDEIMAIGDGENDIEMLKIANLGVALSNGSEKTKAVADVIGLSNDEDGVADAIYRYAF